LKYMISGNIYLVGFMGAGKSSVGRRLAEAMQRSFIDLDLEIEKRAGKPIREIFSAEGEPRFRELERNELLLAAGSRHTVIALGGGAFIDERNRQAVQNSGISVWLDVSIETIFSRCIGDPSRPLFASREQMLNLLEARRSSYQSASIHITADGLDVDSIVSTIIEKIQEMDL
jgi:shikimate kinase